ncbi:unnamed protein product [Ectocarpus sp. 4 AP-2014]
MQRIDHGGTHFPSHAPSGPVLLVHLPQPCIAPSQNAAMGLPASFRCQFAKYATPDNEHRKGCLRISSSGAVHACNRRNHMRQTTPDDQASFLILATLSLPLPFFCAAFHPPEAFRTFLPTSFAKRCNYRCPPTPLPAGKVSSSRK